MSSPSSSQPSTSPVPQSDEIAAVSDWIPQLEGALSEVIVGQENLVQSLTLGLLTGGHILLEGVPGLAKSLAVSCMAQAVHASFNRLQFTPDLLPSDPVGTEIYNAKSGEFAVRKGPIFANFVLADEINRAPAKVQSALLEGMQEHQVSIGGTSFPLPKPFMVLATQNPIEQEGTYPLPEAQLDRFALKVVIGYPDRDDELASLDRMGRTAPKMTIDPVVDLDAIARSRDMVDRIVMDRRLAEYVVDLVGATRDPEAVGAGELAHYVEYGASPRACIWLTLVARAHAFMKRRGYVTPGDIKAVAIEVLRHRVIPTYEAEADGLDSEQIVARLLETVPVP